MPAVNFYPRFADQVLLGHKRQTIRLRQFHPGATLYLLTGQRTARCQRLGVGTVTRCRPVVVDFYNYVPRIVVDDVALSVKEMEAFARADGFVDLDSFMDFFSDHHDLPLAAWVTEWELAEQTEAVAA